MIAFILDRPSSARTVSARKLPSRASLALLIFALLSSTLACGGEVVAPPPTRDLDVPLRLSPVAVEGAVGAWALFDRDTTTTWTPGDEPVELFFGAPREVHEVRVFAAGEARVTLEGDDGWQLTVELEPAGGWTTLALEEPRRVESVRVSTLDPPSSGAIAELEIWSRRPLSFGALRQSHFRARYERPLEEAVIPHRLDVADARPSFAVLGGPEGGSRCAVFSLELPRPAAAYRRVFVGYRTQGVFRPFALSRSVNDATSRDGVLLVEGGEPSIVLEPLDPSALEHGANTIRFCLPGDATQPAVLQRVRVFAELDDGMVRVDEEEAPPSLAEVTEEEGLYLPFTRLMEPHRIVLTEASTVAWALTCFDANGEPHDIDARVLLGASGTVAFEPNAPSSCEAIALRPRSPAASIGSAQVFGSPTHRPTDWPRIVVTSAQEHFGRVAWVEGWLDDVTGAPWLANLTVNGVSVPTVGGGFATLIERADDSAPDWPVVLTATFPDGEIVVRRMTLSLTDPLDLSGWDPGTGTSEENATAAQDAAQFGPEGGSASNVATPEEGGEIWLGSRVGVSVPPGAVDRPTDITVIHIGGELLPRLDPGMVNVTAPRGHGYEMLPHGQRFATPIEVVVPFDSTLIPAGQTAEDVHTFYYESRAKEWRKLQRARVAEDSGVVRSLTDHFTLMINATVVAPEHPELASFNPTQMKDIQAANPAAGINLIEPPSANSQGDARLAYPIEVPPGRHGMQPDLAITYSSSHSNGWLGVGWDLNVPSITIDTRWGVPRYDPDDETETYLLDGQQLTPLAHRDAAVARNGPQGPACKRFHARVEGAFAKIERCGFDPSGYFWQVIDKEGRELIFGNDRLGTEWDPNALLTTGPGGEGHNIFRWPLRRITDANGNRMELSYSLLSDPGTHGSLFPVMGTELYLASIHYTGDSSFRGPYEVRFLLDRADERRPDPIIDARGGFKRVTAKRLRRVEVLFREEQVRAYELDYQVGAFGKSLLSAIRQLGPNDEPFPGGAHLFEYFDEVSGVDALGRPVVNGFAGTQDLDIESDGVVLAEGFPSETNATALNGSDIRAGGGSLYLGVAVPGFGKSLSAGVQLSVGGESSQAHLELVDVDGDGLPDKVFESDGSVFFRKNISRPGGDRVFSDQATEMQLAAPLAARLHLSESASKSISVAQQAHVLEGLASVSLGVGVSSTQALTYFSDVNADGVPDLVDRGLVLFGRVAPDGQVTFDTSSEGTFMPLGPSFGCADEALLTGQQEMRALIEALSHDVGLSVDVPDDLAPLVDLVPSLEDGIGGLVSDFLEVRDGSVVTGALVDTVQRWESPFDGTVSISGDPTLSPDSNACAGSDGVRVAIEHGTGDLFAVVPTSAVSELWSGELTLDAPSATPSGVSQVEVQKGDRLYFRVGSVFDGECDQVRWDPQITYDGDEALDANGLDAHSYRASTDFTLAGARGTRLELPLAGTVALEGTFSKLSATSDDVELTITLEHTDPLTGVVTGAEEVETISLDASETDDVDVSWSGEVVLGDRLRAHIKVRSPIDVRQLRWVPRAIYTSLEDEDLDADAVPSLFLPYDVDVYPRVKNEGPEEAWVVPPYDSDTIKLSPRVAGSVEAGGSLTFSVKRRGELVAQSTVVVVLGLQLPGTGELVLALEEDDDLFFEISTTDPALFDHITSFSTKARYKDGDDDVEIDVPVSLYGASPDTLFSGAYRGWAVAGYRAAGVRETDPLEELDFILTESTSAAPGFQAAFAFSPSFDFGEDRELWRGPTGGSWLAAGRMSSSRTGGVVHLGPQVANGTCIAPPRISATLQYSQNGSLVVGGGGLAVGLTASLLDYLDMNGDGFPDIAGFGFLQLTDPRGGLFPEGVRFAPLQALPVRFGLAATGTVSVGPGMRQAIIQANAGGRSDASTRGPLANGWSGSLEGVGSLVETRLGIDGGLSVGTADLIDINGDGLPDRVTVDNVGVIVPVLDLSNVNLANMGSVLDGISEASELFLIGVELNLGDGRFGVHERWGPGLMSFGTNVGAGVSAGASLPTPIGVGGEVALAFRGSGANSALLDMNGDGLVDLVQPFGDGALRVAFNTGAGFTEALPWRGAQTWDWSDVAEDFSRTDQFIPEAAHDKTVAFQAGGHLTASGIPVPCGCPTGVLPIGVASVGVSVGVSAGLQQVAIRDIDGDGYPDDLLSAEEGTLHVALNRTGRTNLLRVIERPLRGRIELDYARSGNTLLQPQNRWVLSRVDVADGLPDDWQEFDGQEDDGRMGADFQVASFEYEGGLYDRFEREFLGFAKVAETEHDTTGLAQADLSSAPPYRRVVRTYGTFPDNDDERCELPATDMRNRYCGRPFAGKGLLVSERVEDVQGSGPPRLFSSTINTYSFKNGLNGETVDDASSPTASLFPALEDVERRVYEGGTVPIATNLSQHYDRFGNVVRYVDTGDVDAADNVTARITYSDCAESHILGKPDSIIVVDSTGRELFRRDADIDCGTGNTTELRAHVTGGVATTTLAYGSHGNLINVTGPENENGQRYRLDFTYDDETDTYVTNIRDSFGYESQADYDLRFGHVKSTMDSNGNVITNTYDDFGRLKKVVGPYEAGAYEYTLTFDYHPDAEVPFAHTRHMDPQRDPGDPIETFLFIDGLGRVVQTKKDATVHQGENQPPLNVMIVSGRVAFDHASRVRAQHYPMEEVKGADNTSFSTLFHDAAPTRTAYDVLDRATQVTLPDGTITAMTYTLAEDAGRRRLSTLIRDANGNERQTFRDVRGLVTAVHEQSGGAIVTRYTHDPLQRLTHITDDAGNVTRIEYDQLGRRTAIDNPDTGRVKLVWDLAGNLTQKVTPTLRAQGQAIRYLYRFNRLQHILYPSHPENNVTYEYGGAEEKGEPGNLAGRLKRVVDASGVQERLYGRLGEVVEERRTINHTSGDPATYVTGYQFDTWGRLHSLTYPDGEVLTYTYDSGGLVSSVRGVKDRFEYPYLVRVEHDAFEQRAFMETGTGIKTTYRYDSTDRRLEELAAGDFQKLSYFYDDVGNITDLVNDAAPAGRFGGQSNQHFDYDSLYRLKTATGELRTHDSHVHNYELSLGYNDIHNIVQKDQTHRRTTPDGTVKVQRGTTYNHPYQYTGAKPHAPSHIGERTYAYDANGNQAGWLETSSNQRRSISWDEENRIRSVDDNGRETRFVYDDAGERVLKVGRGETAYVNQHFTVRSRNQKTKHVWVGTSRIVSKLVPGDDTPDDEVGDGEEDEAAICNPLHEHGSGHIAGHVHGRDGQGHEAYHCHGEEDGAGEPPPPEEEEPPPCALEDEPDEKNFVYFFHPDHLGSTSFVTDCQGEVYRHIAYFPFGETWVEQASETNRVSHLYAGKEFDEETGLYYYGARYYDPRTSVWQSPDPAFLEQGAIGLSVYHYAGLNPVRNVDPDGRKYFAVDSDGNKIPLTANQARAIAAAGAPYNNELAILEMGQRDDVEIAFQNVPENDPVLQLISKYMKSHNTSANIPATRDGKSTSGKHQWLVVYNVGATRKELEKKEGVQVTNLEHILSHELGEVWAKITAAEGRDVNGQPLVGGSARSRSAAEIHEIGLDFENRVRVKQGLSPRPAPPLAPSGNNGDAPSSAPPKPERLLKAD